LSQGNFPVYMWLNVAAKSTTTVRLFSGKKESSSEKSVPQRRLTRYQMDYLRSLRADFPDLWPLRKLAKHFRISYPAVVKILKSKFQPSEEVAERQDKRTVELRNKVKSKVHIEEKKEALISRIKYIKQTNHGTQTGHKSLSQTVHRQQSQTEFRPQLLHSARSRTDQKAQTQHRSQSQTEQCQHRSQSQHSAEST